jgi:hypothetical protein
MLRDFTNRPVCAARSHPALERRGVSQVSTERIEPNLDTTVLYKGEPPAWAANGPSGGHFCGAPLQ